jgi:tRNA dimethylallyltransferase
LRIGDERGDEVYLRHDVTVRDGREVRRALLIAGPTASGKSALALALAERLGATIVNADSMQVYRDLRVLTARPTEAEQRLAPHELFGAIDGAENFSAGRWLAAVRALLAASSNSGMHQRSILFVGGTGLYFRALTQGLSAIPHVPDGVRQRVRAEAEGASSEALHARLARVDPLTAARLRSSDRQRILRALEVLAASGAPLASFHGAREPPLLRPGEWTGLFLAPERAELTAAIERRFDAMLEAGALGEVAALAARRLDPALPVMRAHGVPRLIAHLNGDLSLDEAAALAKADTRRYAKRQFTWARHQMPEFAWTAPEDALAAATRLLEGFRAARP